MPIDPFLAPILAAYPQTPEHIDDYPAFRAQERIRTDGLVTQLAEPGPEVAERHRVTIPVAGGTIDLLVYRPHQPGPHPVHVYLHGGAWMVGSVDHVHVDITCRERCIGARCVVVSVDYRKAPEHPCPTALDDCAAALRWVVEHAGELGARPDLLTVGGTSAGGNLAAALCLRNRDEAGPPIAFQLLEVPALDLTFSLPSQQEYGIGYALASRDLEIARWAYLTAHEPTGPYISPLLAPDLSDLPPAHLMAAEYDVLRDDAVEYARRLEEAGVPVTCSVQPGHVHVSGLVTAAMESARVWRAELLTVLRRAHEQVPA